MVVVLPREVAIGVVHNVMTGVVALLRAEGGSEAAPGLHLPSVAGTIEAVQVALVAPEGGSGLLRGRGAGVGAVTIAAEGDVGAAAVGRAVAAVGPPTPPRRAAGRLGLRLPAAVAPAAGHHCRRSEGVEPCR